MPKAKSPLFDTIRGTLAKSVTCREYGTTPDIVVSAKPVPTDRRTPAQATIRDAYARAAENWRTVEALDKNRYEAAAKARKLTIWNVYLSAMLPVLRMNPILYLPLTDPWGSVVMDFAPGGQALTMEGCYWYDGYTPPVLNFDGQGQRLVSARPGYYDRSPDFSLLLAIASHDVQADACWLAATKAWQSDLSGFVLFQNPNRTLSFNCGNGDAWTEVTSAAALPAYDLNVVAVRKSGADVTITINGASETLTGAFAELAPSSQPFTLMASAASNYGTYGFLLDAEILPPTVSQAQTEARASKLYSDFAPIFL